MLGGTSARASDLFFLGASVLRRGKEGTDSMRSHPHEFGEARTTEARPWHA
jgi:hypothetical protein